MLVPASITWLIPILGLYTEPSTEQGEKHPVLTLAIIPTRGKPGSFVIDHAQFFRVDFTNHSAKPLRLWHERSQPGHKALTFRIEDQSGRCWTMSRRPVGLQVWKDQPEKTVEIPPHGTISWTVVPSVFSWDEAFIWDRHEWKSVPEPNTGQTYMITARFETKPTAAAKTRKVWVGLATSAPVETQVVDPALRTPHKYLIANCPEQALRLFQANPASLNRTDADGCTPLHLAARYGFTEVVSWLVAHGANVNATAYGRSPLHFANEPEIVEALLRGKPNLGHRNSAPAQTPLEHAASRLITSRGFPAEEAARWMQIIKLLRDAGAPYDIQTAIYLDDIARVRAIVQSEPALARERRDAHDVPLRLAARIGRIEICKLLIDFKADVEDLEEGLGYPILYDGIKYPEIVKLLLKSGARADVRITWRGGRSGQWLIEDDATPLHFAAEKGAVESAKILLEHKAKIDAVDVEGHTPLYVAAILGQAEMVRFLLDRGAKPDVKAKNGKSPLDVADVSGAHKGAAEALREFKRKK